MGINKVSSRKEKAAHTKNKIYNSAVQLFSERGFENVNIDDIVKHAGVAKGSFYVHYKTKNTLLAILINDYVSLVDRSYKTFLETLPPDMPAHEVFLSLVGKICDVISNDIGVENMNLLYRIQLGKEPSISAALSYNRELYKIFFDIINKGLQQKVIKSSLPADELAKQFVIVFRGLTYEWCARYPDFDLKKQSLELFDLLLRGIR